jgi:hypothetical protein
MKFANKIIISDIWIRQIGKVAYEIRQKNNYFSYTDSPIGEIRGETRQLAKFVVKFANWRSYCWRRQVLAMGFYTKCQHRDTTDEPCVERD